MEKQKSSTEIYYDKLSEVYDAATGVANAWSPPSYVAAAINSLKGQRESLLIAGFGTGRDLEAIGTGLYAHVEGVDISEGMLNVARVKFPVVDLHHCDFMEFSGFLRNSYDTIICSGTAEFIQNFEGFLTKCHSLLKVGGHLVLTYEPQILNHTVQAELSSSTVSERSSDWGIEGSITYRRPLGQFLNITTSLNFGLIDFFEFVSYRKLEVDVIYHFAVLKKL